MAYNSITSFKVHNAQTRFPGLPLAQDGNGYWWINYVQVRYMMPESIAEKLATFWRKQNQSMADVKQWFDELPSKDQQFVVRYDLNNQQYL
jgi:hypothetical protein